MNHKKCDKCPIEGHDQCLAADHPDHFGRWCQWAESGDEFRRKVIVGRSKFGFVPLVDSPQETSKIPLAENQAIIKSINECPERSRRITSVDEHGQHVIVHVFTDESGVETLAGDCGCGMNRCRINKGRGDGFVSIDDCRACIKEKGVVEVTEKPAPTTPLASSSLGGLTRLP